MTATRRVRPISVILLTIVVGFQALGGLYGGAALVLDPSGSLLGLPLVVLERTPFADFLVPGLILLVVLGLLPLGVAIALWSTPAWRAAASIERIFGAHWAWVGAGVVAVGLIIWLAVELWMVGSTGLLLVFTGVAAAMLGLTLLPSTRRYYRV